MPTHRNECRSKGALDRLRFCEATLELFEYNSTAALAADITSERCEREGSQGSHYQYIVKCVRSEVVYESRKLEVHEMFGLNFVISRRNGENQPRLFQALLNTCTSHGENHIYSNRTTSHTQPFDTYPSEQQISAPSSPHLIYAQTVFWRKIALTVGFLCIKRSRSCSVG